jgi:hypothetical protein
MMPRQATERDVRELGRRVGGGGANSGNVVGALDLEQGQEVVASGRRWEHDLELGKRRPVREVGKLANGRVYLRSLGVAGGVEGRKGRVEPCSFQRFARGRCGASG